MPENRVMAVGFVVSWEGDQSGSLHVKTWTRLCGSGTPQTEEYEHLTYLEAMEVVNVHADCNRPGWAIGDGWSHPPLFPPAA